MFHRGLKFNVAVNIAFLLLPAMILINLVTSTSEQKNLIRSEVSKGYLLISAFEDKLKNLNQPGGAILNVDSKYILHKMLRESGFSPALVMDKNLKQKYIFGAGHNLQNNLEKLTRSVIQSGNKTVGFSGTTWGVFWKQRKYLIISVPLFRDGVVFAGTSIVLPLEDVYKTVRRSQYLFLIYILINTVFLTFIGVHRLSRITVDPIRRLVKRADQYREDDELFFLYDKEDTEFNRLSKSLNRMLERIAEDKEKLKKTVASLEKVNFDLKQAQNNIIRAEKLASVGRLSSGIAHEIGNPLGIVSGYLELLKQKDITNDEQQDYIARTEQEIGRINIIIRQLLDFSRTSKKEYEVVSVHEIIADMANIIEFQPFMSNINLKLGLLAKNDKVMANSDQLRQVFMNLIINAADAISSDTGGLSGEIIITCKELPAEDADSAKDPPMLKIEFTDNGPGINIDSIGNVFDPFYTTKDPGKGTGLGLSVCFMIVERFSGKIEAASKKNQGATFTISLPLYQP